MHSALTLTATPSSAVSNVKIADAGAFALAVCPLKGNDHTALLKSASNRLVTGDAEVLHSPSFDTMCCLHVMQQPTVGFCSCRRYAWGC